MKLSLFLIFSVCGTMAASSQVKLTFSFRDADIRDVIAAIEKETNYVFMYRDGILDLSGTVSLEVQNASLEEVMNAICDQQGITYEVRQRQVILEPRANPPKEQLQQQKRALSGTVTDSSGLPIPGVSVIIKGTTIGTITNDQGTFSLVVPQSAQTLVFSFVGMKAVERPIEEATTFLVQMEEDRVGVDEVVVVGYSDKKKSELTSAVTVVSSEKLKDITANNVGTMLQGKVAGLQVVNSSGAPGSSPEIRLRGISSVNASQSPLYVVDGIIGGNYDPNDVESVTVLKDAGATAMYGSQANGGVIIITTKKAKNDKTKFEAKVTTGFRTPDYGKMEMMNGSQMYEYQKELYRDYVVGASNNSYKIDLLQFYDERPRSLRDQNYNWLDEIFSPAVMQNYYFSFTGRTQKNDYYVGVSYYNEKGTFMNTDFQRVNLRANSTHHFSERITLTNNINLSGSTGKSYDYMDVYYAYLNMPWDNPYDSTGKPLYVDGNSTFTWWSRDKMNPIHTIKNSNHPYKNFDAYYDLGLTIAITDWLTFSSTNRGAINYASSTSYYSSEVAGTYNGTGYLSEERDLTYGGVSNNLLKFNFNLGEHSISGLAGVAVEGSKTEAIGGSGQGLPEGLRVLNVVSSNILVSGFDDKSVIQSFISQVNYSYKGKYFLTGSYRVDGSSAFPESNRYASFPAISAAWLVNNEPFFEGVPVIDNLKLRASYGVTGTQDIGASRYLGLYSLSSQYNSSTAATPEQLPSPNLTWESKYQLNAGVDISLFKRVNLAVDVYHNVTKDLLLQVSQPLSIGFEERWENSGEVVNNGLEINLGTVNIKTKNFEWTTDFNINFNTNKLRKLPGDIIRTDSRSVSQIYSNRGNLYEFYMPKWLGVDPQTGGPLWELVTTDDAGKVIGREATSDYASATYQTVGSALPKFQGGITSAWRYKNISLSANAYFLYGNKVFSNNLRYVMNDGSEPYMNQIVLPDEYSIWKQPGDIATNPSPQNASNSTEPSTRFLKDGSYLALRNITLSYELPQAYTRKLRLDGIVVSLSADNVYTFTKFLGQDPQTTITSSTYVTPGVSDFKYPNNRQFLFNVNLIF